MTNKERVHYAMGMWPGVTACGLPKRDRKHTFKRKQVTCKTCRKVMRNKKWREKYDYTE